MSENTEIEWTDRTWNPIRGCSRISAGCENCYAERLAARFSKEIRAEVDAVSAPFGVVVKTEPFHGFAKMTTNGPRWTGRVELVPEKLAEPLSWRKPARVFVNSMSDLFHESLSDEAIDNVFAVMAIATRHTFQVLTKRAERMRAYLSDPKKHERWYAAAEPFLLKWDRCNGGWTEDWFPRYARHIHIGVSVENQAAANERIPQLLATPAAVRFLSVEPLLGPVDLTRVVIKKAEHPERGEPPVSFDALKGTYGGIEDGRTRVDWVIVGGESGPKARSCYLEWFAAIVRQCKAASAPVFVKQLGANIIDRRGSEGRDEYGMWPYAVPSKFINEQFTKLRLWDRKGGDPREWPEALRVPEFPGVTA